MKQLCETKPLFSKVGLELELVVVHHPNHIAVVVVVLSLPVESPSFLVLRSCRMTCLLEASVAPETRERLVLFLVNSPNGTWVLEELPVIGVAS